MAELQQQQEERPTATKSCTKSPSGQSRSVLTILRTNPDVCKTILALGLYTIVSNVPSTLVVTALQGEFWGDSMASNQAMVNVCMYLLSVLATGPLGRFGDRFGNRIVVAFALFLTALPVYVLLLVGTNRWGLTLWAVARVISGLSGASMTGSPALLALVNEVSAPGDVEQVLGLGFAGVSIFWFFGSTIGMGINSATSPRIVLAFVAGVSLLGFATLATIRPYSHRQSSIGDKAAHEDAGAGEAAAAEEGQSAGQAHRDLTRAASVEMATKSLALFDTTRFVWGNASLRCLCIVAMLVSIPETILFDAQMQYYFSELGLLGGGSAESSRHRRVLIAFLVSAAVQFALTTSAYPAGLMSKKFSPRRVLLFLIPFSAIFDCMPLIVLVVQQQWAVVFSALMLGLSLAVLPPLQALVTVVSPPDRVSEAMGAVGAFKCIASLVGNLLLFFAVPALNRSGLKHPLWLIFVASSLITLCGFAVALRIPKSPAMRSGAEAVSVDDQSETVDMADLDYSSSPATSERETSAGNSESSGVLPSEV